MTELKVGDLIAYSRTGKKEDIKDDPQYCVITEINDDRVSGYWAINIKDARRPTENNYYSSTSKRCAIKIDLSLKDILGDEQ